MKNEYRREMERIGPRPEELERLYQMIKGETEMKKQKKLGGRMAAILVCAALMVTAAAAVPTVREAFQTVREALQTYLGSFAPYAQTIDGVVCTDQGIEIQVLNAISDEREARFYLAVRDMEEDRLSEFLRLDGSLVAGEAKDPDRNSPGMAVVGGFSTDYFELISYDPETKTALFSASILYMDSSRPTGDAQLSITGMNTLQGEVYEYISCVAVTGATLESLPADESNKVVFSPSTVQGIGYTDDVLPGSQVVLAPGQTPMSIEGTEVVRISSVGFASDGCFHIRLEFAGGMAPWLNESIGDSMFYADLMDGSGDLKYYVCQERLVENGMDILFPLIKAEDLEEVQSRQARIYGIYKRPGVDIGGDWSAQFHMDYYSSVTLDWTGELAGWQVRRVTVSPLSVTMNAGKSDSSGGLNAPVYAVKKDGSTVSAEPGTSQYTNVGALNGGGDSWEAYATWRFEEPVDVEDIISLSLGNEVIPVN